MKHTDIAVLCQKCAQEFRVFCDDGAGDVVTIWNWCPHCGQRNELWHRYLKPDEAVPLGISSEEARKRFGVLSVDIKFDGTQAEIYNDQKGAMSAEICPFCKKSISLCQCSSPGGK